MQKTAYAMRISDWRSDVCSSDLPRALALAPPPAKAGGGWEGVPTVRADPKGTPPQPSPAFAGEGAEARGFRRSYGDAGSADARSSKPARRSASIRGCRLEAGERGQPFTVSIRSEENTSELQSLMSISYAVFRLKNKNTKK